MVEQRFTTEIQRLEHIDIQWGTYYRANAGTVLAELIDLRSGAVLLSRSFDAAGIQEGGLTTLAAEAPIEGAYQAPLLLRVTADSQSGGAASPLMNTQEKKRVGNSPSTEFPHPVCCASRLPAQIISGQACTIGNLRRQAYRW